MSAPELMEKIKQIETTRCSIGAQEMRLRLLKMAMGARVDQPAEYAIITGCRSTSAFIHLSHFVKLLQHYEVDYTFLADETCCGNSFIEHLDAKEMGEEIKVFEDYARNFEGSNIARIRELGAKKIVTVCAGCNTRYNQFQANGDFEVLYYTQFLTQYVEGLRLDKQVDFYEGCHKYHRTPDFKIDTQTSKSLLMGITELDCTDIPNYCCRNLSEKIFEKSSTGTIVTPTSCCWAHLTRNRQADSPQVLSLTQIICQALGIA